MSTWNPNAYLKFAGERTQPAIDLLARISLNDPHKIIDLGCGPGNSTALLYERWPTAEIAGLDNSAEMIAAAEKSYPQLKWILGDISSWNSSASFDLIFSNAAFHWVKNHKELFPRILSRLKDGGVLAVQMPAHFQSPVHQLIIEISRDGAWNHLMDGARDAIAVGRPSFYYDLLRPRCSRLEMWETEYNHIMDSRQAIIDWMRTTGLRPFLESLGSDDLKQKYEQMLLAGLESAYPSQRDGKVIFPFRRLFMISYR